MKKFISVIGLLVALFDLSAQTKSKEINHQSQSWFSINSKTDVYKKWSVLADVHVRRNHFLADPSFFFVRGALAYNINHNLYVAIGYAHMWVAPATTGWKTWSNENRIYQQVQYSSSVGKISLLQRLRSEERWQQKIANDNYTGQKRFTDRIRYLLSATIPVFKNKQLPALVVADEIQFQFGKEVVYNTFDQNRYFIGIKENINHQLSFDMGYMKVYQQKYSGYQYDSNDTFRLFFYYNGSLCKK
ncbi:MAG: DUF2490 domain-containing protein [Sphingobacteriales bacterium]|nr:DUF2490 domain-containing protein [Sphingobacteriales bacterium]MBI3719833.1 DUF2490 domain-containing protein [Sphingobacteriales bacterium]